MTRLPDGLEQRHTKLGSQGWFVLGVLPTVLLGGILVAALLGLFGGGQNTTFRVRSADAEMIANLPQRLRNGEFFEMRIKIRARTALAKPTLLVAPAYWKDLTVNTMVPAAAKEDADAHAYRLEYPAMAAGEVLTIKIDGQINPSLFRGTRGFLAVADGDRRLLELPVQLKVLP